MDTERHEMSAIQSLRQTAERRQKDQVYTALGFTSNLDQILDFRVDSLNRLLGEYLPDADLAMLRPARLVRTMEELLGTIVYFCVNGIGGEVDIDTPSLITNSFSCTDALGGTAVQAARALSMVGVHSIVHLTDDCKEVCRLLTSPYVHVAKEDGSLGGTDEVVSHNPKELHFILQFKKGDVIELGNRKYPIPGSNRLILTRNTVNEILPLWEPYFRWIEEHARQVTSHVLSSFNSILDPDLLSLRLEEVKRHVEIYHERNPQGIVYFEDAHYHNAQIRRICMDTLYPYVDIMSMNEEELQYTLEKMYQYPVDIHDVLSCVEGTEFLRREYRVRKGIVIHTKDYAMFVGDPGRIPVEKGLLYGVTLATAKAAFGGYGGEQEIREILKLPQSPDGAANVRMIADSPWRDRVRIVPTRYIDKPKYTIGLGDSFTGGMQMCF